MAMSMVLSLTLYNTDMLLVLNPKEKMGYFKKHWSADLQEEVMKCVEEIVRIFHSSISGSDIF
jgi:hypothetical protein